MKMMKWLALSGLTLLLAACGGGEGSGGTAKPVTASRTETSVSAASTLRKGLAASRIEAATPEQAADQLFNFAQASVHAGFFPGNPATQSYPPFRYRAYSNGVLLGVVVTDGMGYTLNGVYAMGGEFGGSPLYVGQLTDFIKVADPNATLTFSPSLVQLTGYSGDTPEFGFYIRTSQPLSEFPRIVVVDSNARLKLWTTSTSFKPNEYRATIQLSPNVPAGHYVGRLEVRLCFNLDVACSNPHPGSPAYLPYDLTVHPSTDLKPLRALPGALAWSSVAGNAANNAYIGSTVNPTSFTRRFRWTVNNYNSTDNFAIANGRAHFITESNGVSRIYAIDEASGKLLWIREVKDWQLRPLTANGSEVYVTSGRVGVLRTFDAETPFEKRQIALGGRQATSALIQSNKLYVSTSDSNASNMVRVDPTDLVVDWSAKLNGVEKTAAFAVDDAHVYAHDGFRLHIVRKSDGSVLSSIKDPRTTRLPEYGREDTLVLDGVGGAYLAHRVGGYPGERRMIRFDVVKSEVSWQQFGKFVSNPVIANGVLYVNAESRFEARSPVSGELLWSWAAPGAMGASLLVVGDLAFVGVFSGLESTTYAIDLTTRKSVWSYWKSGPLALSENGILYIAPAGHIVAINLH